MYLNTKHFAILYCKVQVWIHRYLPSLQGPCKLNKCLYFSAKKRKCLVFDLLTWYLLIFFFKMHYFEIHLKGIHSIPSPCYQFLCCFLSDYLYTDMCKARHHILYNPWQKIYNKLKESTKIGVEPKTFITASA